MNASANAKLVKEKSRNHHSETLEEAEPKTSTREPYLEMGKMRIIT